MARTVSARPDIFTAEEITYIENRIEKIQIRLNQEVKLVEEIPFWNYINGKAGDNDLIHQCFILEGIMEMRQYSKGVDYSWPQDSEIQSIDSYTKEGRIYSYSLLREESEAASLYDLGGILHYYCVIEDSSKANDVLKFTTQTYKNIQDDEIEDAREILFFLKGVAAYNY